jgi:hypothetical protein
MKFFVVILLLIFLITQVSEAKQFDPPTFWWATGTFILGIFFGNITKPSIKKNDNINCLYMDSLAYNYLSPNFDKLTLCGVTAEEEIFIELKKLKNDGNIIAMIVYDKNIESYVIYYRNIRELYHK